MTRPAKGKEWFAKTPSKPPDEIESVPRDHLKKLRALTPFLRQRAAARNIRAHWENIKANVELALRSQARRLEFREFTQFWMAALGVGLNSGCS